MMNDSVRVEVLPKVSISNSLKIEMKESSSLSGKLTIQKTVVDNEPYHQTKSAALPNPVAPKQTTSELAAKPTSPTLVEFHSKNSPVPEWRLQLQNAIRKRKDRENPPTEKLDLPVAAPNKTKFVTSGANALKVEIAEEKKPARQKNPTLNSALERIEKSRQKFLVEEEEQAPIEPVVSARPANKNFPFYIASKQAEVAPANVKTKTSVEIAEPKLAASLRIESGDLGTNKLPSLASKPANISTSFARTVETTPKIVTKTPKVVAEKVEAKIEEKNEIEIKPIANEEILAPEENYEEFEDSAPLAMRFNAGLFDLIIGGFLSLFLLAPFMLMGGSWLTFTGVLAFLATCSIVMFIYLTSTIGYYGRTFGMRLFSLEVIDIEGEHYPTLHQAAVSSAVYLLTLAFGGVGFLTLLFNGERRAAHDLISGTVVVKET
jgi:uncharacterized RDD family membrane protein YckC